LIENLKETWLPFLKPDFTKFIEDQLEDIKDRKKNMDFVIESVRDTFLSLFDKFLKEKTTLLSKISSFKQEIEPKIETNIKTKEFPLTSSMCPWCKTHPMKLITTKKKKRFLICTNEDCEKKYLSVPKRGRIYILKSVCLKCGFNVFKIRYRKNKKTIEYYICPNCWTRGFDNNSGEGFCSNCQDFKISNGICVKKS
jgi:hypothetical protein